MEVVVPLPGFVHGPDLVEELEGSPHHQPDASLVGVVLIEGGDVGQGSVEGLAGGLGDIIGKVRLGLVVGVLCDRPGGRVG